jgi:cyclopropane fatty-acyl-phospholipid synthase-like methyltransferase
LYLQLLDLGCGYGGTAVHIAERLKCKAVGVNISPFQVTKAVQSVCTHAQFGAG